MRKDWNVNVKKHIIIALLSMVLCFSLAGCNKGYPDIDKLSGWVSVSNRDGDVTIAVKELSDYGTEYSDYYWDDGDSTQEPQYAYIAIYDKTTNTSTGIFYTLIEDTTVEERNQMWIDTWSELADLLYKEESTVTNDLGMEFQYLHLRYQWDFQDKPCDDLRFFLQVTDDTVLDVQVVNYEGKETINVEDYQWLLDSTVLVINEN